MKRKRGKGAGSAGVIGGASGPAAIFSVSRKEMEKRRAEQEAFLERAQKLAVPCAKDFDQTIRYLCETYGAQPCALSKGQRQSVKMNILLNQYPELVGYVPPPLNPTEEELLAYSQKQDLCLERAVLYPEEELGLIIEGYLIPENTAALLREQERSAQPPSRRNWLSRLIGGWTGWWQGVRAEERAKARPLTVLIERTHEYMSFDGPGGSALYDGLARYQGISEEDIRDRSPRFVGYAYLMKKDGIWK